MRSYAVRIDRPNPVRSGQPSDGRPPNLDGRHSGSQWDEVTSCCRSRNNSHEHSHGQLSLEPAGKPASHYQNAAARTAKCTSSYSASHSLAGCSDSIRGWKGPSESVGYTTFEKGKRTRVDSSKFPFPNGISSRRKRQELQTPSAASRAARAAPDTSSASDVPKQRPRTAGQSSHRTPSTLRIPPSDTDLVRGLHSRSKNDP